MKLADEDGGECAVCGGAEFILEVLCVFVVDKQVIFTGLLGVVGARAVGLVVSGQGLDTTGDGLEKTGAVDFNETRFIMLGYKKYFEVYRTYQSVLSPRHAAYARSVLRCPTVTL